MATRRVEGDVFDTGAQFFTAVSPEFRAVVEAAAAAGAVAQWYQRPPRAPDGATLPVWRGATGMTDLPKWIAANLQRDADFQLHLSTRVTELQHDRDQVLVWSEAAGSDPWVAGAVILTPPLPQAITVLPQVVRDAIDAELVQRTYDPCLALLLSLDSPLPPVFNEHGWFRPPEREHPIAWVADNAVKGLPGGSRSAHLTIHSSPAVARRLYDNDQEATAALGEALRELFPTEFRPRIDRALPTATLKKWRFARPTGRSDELSVAVTPQCILAGDAFGGARVEGAFSSGHHAATRVLGRYGV